MNRRAFIALIGAAAAWPRAAHAQQRERMRRIGVLSSLAADDPESQARHAAFLQGLQEWGWTAGRNVQIDYRWGAGDADRIRKYAAELVALAPDVILATGSPVTAALLQATRSAALASEASGQRGDSNTMRAPDTRPEPGSSARAVPIVFAQVPDPVANGFVESLARPGGNATGFTIYEYGTSGKWLELLKEIAPQVTRAAVLRDPVIASGIGRLAAIQGVAPALGVELRPVGVRDAGEIERAVTAFAREPNGGLIVLASPLSIVQRDLIITLAARHRLPAVYSLRFFVTSGGLISYGPDSIEPYRRAAGYVDRILKGEKPGDLPVQAPTKYDLVLNMKTAKALGLTVPPSLLARANEVIE
jgi:putative tryptophan/tyrosine transport system substrate-binding protein